MSTEVDTTGAAASGSSAAASAALDGGNYEIIRSRLEEQAKALQGRADALNDKRKEAFGGTELTVIGNERIRTENNCVPRDIVSVGGKLLLGYNVHIGLRTETKISDVFSLHEFTQTDSSFDLSATTDESVGGFLSDPRFVREFEELYKYYKDATLVQLQRTDGKLIAIFQVGTSLKDIKAFRWAIDVSGNATYIDNRGERDIRTPSSHDFEWKPTTREDHVRGEHPHVSIEDVVFVETVGGDLTIKVEDNTDDGLGVYREPVEDASQGLDDAEIEYARLGSLILIKVLPYREEQWRYLVFNERTKDVKRIDAIGQACVQLPEDHGIIFPGGFYLQTGDTKIFTEDIDDLRFERMVRSPNGEDVLYVFYRPVEGSSTLLSYNLIRKEVANPIPCHGYCTFANGSLTVFRATSDEPTRVHPMQIWQTPFMTAEFAAAAPTDGSFLAKVGNADLVRGISEAYSVQRLIENQKPSRAVYEDLIRSTNRALDTYYWLSHDEVGNLGEVLDQIRRTAELIVDEFEKVQQLIAVAKASLTESEATHVEVVEKVNPEDYREIAGFLQAMTSIRHHRGHLITLKEVRYIDLERIDALEAEAVEAFSKVSRGAVDFLLKDDALGPMTEQIDHIHQQIEASDRVSDAKELEAKVDETSEGLTVLSEVVGDLQVDDPAARTRIVESISEVFAQLNRVRATLKNKKKSLMQAEGKADFAAQFQLFNQTVASAMALADTPEKCDEQLSRVMIQLEELESRFSEFDEFVGDLAGKREEVYDGFSSKKQTLLDERQRRISNLITAAERIIGGIVRRAQTFKTDDELNAYFASDAMVLKLRQLAEQMSELGDSVKADELLSKLKSAKQDALRGLRDRTELYEDGEAAVRFGRHRFSVNTQPLELTIVPRGEGMALHLTGTDFYDAMDDVEFAKTRDFWTQTLVSETDQVYRGEYLAASVLFDAEDAATERTVASLHHAMAEEGGLVAVVREVIANRYDEGYERGLHDADAALILEKLLSLHHSAGLLRFSPDARALACLWWSQSSDAALKASLQRRAQSLGRLRSAFANSPAERDLAAEIAGHVEAFCAEHELSATPGNLTVAGRYLVEELSAEGLRFVTSGDAVAIRDSMLGHLALAGKREAFEADLEALAGSVKERLEIVQAWLTAFIGSDAAESVRDKRHALFESAVLMLTEAGAGSGAHRPSGQMDRTVSSSITEATVTGLLGSHPRIKDGALQLRLDEFLSRLHDFAEVRVPGFRAYREARHSAIERERDKLRLDEFKPRVLSSFVRNKLINDVYLPVIGDNLAKQIGALGESKRTDLMGMLMLISPPGYGKTTLMEYLAKTLGMVFMKVNGPSLGHSVTSIDPAEAPNATARQEVEKINLALEMGNNVMLYLDDIQHTHPELLQKFISLCDAQRRIEGVWRGKTKTYDLRGKKFCVIMAGNPYTESGEKFQIPDMLANRADTYNLGDILEGKDEAFALSYLENALTSNSVLAPLATRSQEDVYKIIRMAQGAQIPSSDLEHGYSAAELNEIVEIFKRMIRCQEVLLSVNQAYITSASQADEYRTEPRFQLQGSYRNMNKLAEKLVSAMNADELEALIDDHYAGEAQTLTTGAEHNVLKLAELRGVMSDAQQARWTEIKKDFARIQSMGGSDDDPVARVTGTLGSLGEQLDGIRESLLTAVSDAQQRSASEQAQLVPQLQKLEAAMSKLAQPSLSVKVDNQPPKGLDEILARQVEALEQTLMPLAINSARNMEETRALGRPLAELIELLKMKLLTPGDGSP